MSRTQEKLEKNINVALELENVSDFRSKVECPVRKFGHPGEISEVAPDVQKVGKIENSKSSPNFTKTSETYPNVVES